MAARVKAGYVTPMLLLLRAGLPEGDAWLYELKFDGYRAIGFKTDGQVFLRSRNNKDFNRRYPDVVRALAELPNETAVDGELVSLDETGRQSFNALQRSSSAKFPVFYFLFDVMILAGRSLLHEPLERRRQLLMDKLLPRLSDPVRFSSGLKAAPLELIAAAKDQGMEGIVAKNRNSPYEPGKRSGAWQKVRTNQKRAFVIGGYTAGSAYFDALVFGYYEGSKLIYAGRTRSGFTPMVRRQLYEQFRKLKIELCPFVNLPESKSGRWGQGLTKEKMRDCRWLQPVLVGQFEFVEWTPDNHLRHSKFVGIVKGKNARNIRRRSGD